MSLTEERRRSIAALATSWGLDDLARDQRALDGLLRYCDLLLTWSARINLTAAESVEALIAEHLPDAFALASRLDGPASVIDVGTGGGLPAIPLAVLRSALTIELCEPIAKKGAFLRTAVRELGLEGRVRVTGGRAQEIAAARPQSFDVATSRATFAPEVWLTLARSLVRPGGRVFALVAADALPDRPTHPGYTQTCRKSYLSGRRAMAELVSTAEASDEPEDAPRD
jgi:16S rRNA (guanine527-N7)-methyltransferase